MEKRIIHGKMANTVLRIPGSKSHTMRALFIAALGTGTSCIFNPLDASDTRSALQTCQAFGAEVTEKQGEWRVNGTGGKPLTPENIIDVGNSGTTLRFAMGLAALSAGWSVITGDEQIRKRPVAPLAKSLQDLGAQAFTSRSDESPPVIVRGPLQGGTTEISCVTSQYLSSLLIATPLAEKDSEIRVSTLNEKPYVTLTLNWLDSQGIIYSRSGWEKFSIQGGQSYRSFSKEIPGDYSSATFFLCGAAITGSKLIVKGLDSRDSQGDREVLDVLKKMGCEISDSNEGLVINGGALKGVTWDLNNIPDALPALAVTACFAEGTTKLVNVPQARVKETDRITVMRKELEKMGARVEELQDGLVIHGGRLRGTKVDGNHDHRVVMALAIAGLGAQGETTIKTAEAAEVTFPDFFKLLDEVQHPL